MPTDTASQQHAPILSRLMEMIADSIKENSDITPVLYDNVIRIPDVGFLIESATGGNIEEDPFLPSGITFISDKGLENANDMKNIILEKEAIVNVDYQDPEGVISIGNWLDKDTLPRSFDEDEILSVMTVGIRKVTYVTGELHIYSYISKYSHVTATEASREINLDLLNNIKLSEVSGNEFIWTGEPDVHHAMASDEFLEDVSYYGNTTINSLFKLEQPGLPQVVVASFEGVISQLETNKSNTSERSL